VVNGAAAENGRLDRACNGWLKTLNKKAKYLKKLSDTQHRLLAVGLEQVICRDWGPSRDAALRSFLSWPNQRKPHAVSATSFEKRSRFHRVGGRSVSAKRFALHLNPSLMATLHDDSGRETNGSLVGSQFRFGVL
jgi:hypothetical protein